MTRIVEMIGLVSTVLFVFELIEQNDGLVVLFLIYLSHELS